MSVSSIVVRVAACCLSAMPLSAQCATSGGPNHGLAGVLGTVFTSVEWDRDGAGPLPPLLVLGGSFQSAGGIAAANIAAFDPAAGTWSPFGSGMQSAGMADAVFALAVLPNGDLIAGGDFLTAGGVLVNRIARWDGVSWSPLGAGCSARVVALAVLPNGDLVAGGSFSTAGGITTNGVARWNGAAWAGLTGGIPFANVNSLHVLANGDLVVGGFFTTAGGVAANNIARWDGSAWSALGAGLSSFAGSLATLPNGDLVAANGTRVERWDGTSWGPLGVVTGSASLGIQVSALAVLANGDLVVGGSFTAANGVPAHGIARWNGSAWTALDTGVAGSGAPRAAAIVEWSNGDLFVGGQFSTAGSVGVANVARFAAGSWSALAPGFNDPIEAMITMPNGDVVVGGSFSSAGTIAASQIARWNGSSWQPLGVGVAVPANQDPTIRSLAVAPNGDLLCAGRFYGGMGVGADIVARWNGSAWAPLGLPPGIVSEIDALPDGSPVVVGTLTFGGAFHAFRWDGSAWLPLGTPLPGPSDAVLALTNGDVLVSGRNFAGNFYLWRWDGSAWSPFATFIDGDVYVMVEADNGDVIVGGRFTYFANMFANRIARWNGTSWSPLGAGLGGSSAATSVRAIGELPNGELVVGGTFETAGGVPAQGLARWSATGWSAMVPGSQNVTSLAITPRGEIVMGGYFAGTGTTLASYFAYLATNCPAQSSVFGAGCGGSSGVNVLSSTAPAWVGATARSAASSLPSVSIAAIVRGFSTLNVPLASLLPAALPGCDLLVQPDSVDAAISDPAGVLSLQLVVPNSTALGGLVYHEQVVSISTANGAITSTNGLTRTVGTL
jgi:trimeric autotransporter adhesin